MDPFTVALLQLSLNKQHMDYLIWPARGEHKFFNCNDFPHDFHGKTLTRNCSRLKITPRQRKVETYCPE